MRNFLKEIYRAFVPPVCTMMIGVPGSGKSTWIKNYVPGETPVLSMDSIREGYSRANDIQYQETFRPPHDGVCHDAFDLSLTKLLSDREDFVWDQTNINTVNREDKLAILKHHGFKIHAVSFHPPVTKYQRDKVFERNRHGVPRDVWEGLVQQYELPTVWEGFSQRTFVHLPDFWRALYMDKPPSSGWNL